MLNVTKALVDQGSSRPLTQCGWIYDSRKILGSFVCVLVIKLGARLDIRCRCLTQSFSSVTARGQ